MKNILYKILMQIYYILRSILKIKADYNLKVTHKEYVSDTIYNPYYNICIPIERGIPNVYNKSGRKMDFFFIRDIHSAHCPYRDSSKYFIWDRFNIGLDIHFYTHQSMLECMGAPTQKFGLLVESEAIVPDDYLIFQIHKNLNLDFDKILTYSTNILDTIPNAQFFPFAANVFYGKEQGCDIKITDDVYLQKNTNISYICSNKRDTALQRLRLELAESLSKTHFTLIDFFGSFNGGEYVKYKSTTLQKYRFQIVVENNIADYYFSEKILDCFASMTIPIYFGARKIAQFFNPDGIVFFEEKDINDFNKIIQKCTAEYYKERIPVIKENFYMAQKYLNQNDLLYESLFLDNYLWR